MSESADIGSDGWKAKLAGKIAPELAREIDIFETQLELRRQGKIEEKLFAEARLRRGVYGQRYDNGQRNDGLRTQRLAFPSAALTKGPNTLWDAPGMMRIKIPFGGLRAEQMEVIADLSEEYSDGISHVTTRQDIQLHYVHIEDTPALMRRLGAVGVTTREACGNVVRNVTACPASGVCRDESFDVTPYARACAYFLLGHPDAQDFGRKFKVAFSGCKPHPCALTAIHDVGAIAARRTVDGKERRGFEVVVGGGLGAVPHQAKLLDPFLPEEELLPVIQAVCRVFARLGEKKNRSHARLKFLVARLGIDEFRRLVLEERAHLPSDPRWTSFLDDLHAHDDRPLRPASSLSKGAGSPELLAFRATNVAPQRQQGYGVVTVTLPLGDISASQLRALAAIGRRFTGETFRTTVEQNIVLRWVSEGDLPALHDALTKVGLGEKGAGTLADVTACPGTDTCKLGISSSRGLAAELRTRLAEHGVLADAAVRNLRIKVSGCFNACGQHHVADIGFYGVSRNVGSYQVPHFQVVLGGKWSENGGSYGLAVMAVPSKRIPDVVLRLTGRFVRERAEGASFQDFVKQVGKAEIRAMLEDLSRPPSHEAEPSFYSDWGDPRQFSIGDMGQGECAGEVVSPTQFGLADSEREAFEAQVALEQGDLPKAGDLAYRAMLSAAQSLVRMQNLNVTADPEDVVAEFRTRFHDTQLFHDPYAGPKFANFLFRVHREHGEGLSAETAHQRIEEALLFIDAAHACHARMVNSTAAPANG
jgi:sulfite reductase (ferredoxin)